MDRDWSSIDLSNQDLSSRNFSRTDFSNTNLSGVNFANSNLNESLFFNVNLREANFTGASLTNTIFVVTSDNVANLDFTDANLSGAFSFYPVNLTSPNFRRCNMPRWKHSK